MASETKIVIRDNVLYVDNKIANTVSTSTVRLIEFLKDGDVLKVSFWNDANPKTYDVSNINTKCMLLKSIVRNSCTKHQSGASYGHFLKDAKHIMDVYDDMPDFIQDGLWTDVNVVKNTMYGGCKLYFIMFKYYGDFKRSTVCIGMPFVFISKDDANTCAKLFEKRWQFTPSNFIKDITNENNIELYDINNLCKFVASEKFNSIRVSFRAAPDDAIYWSLPSTHDRDFLKNVLIRFCKKF